MAIYRVRAIVGLIPRQLPDEPPDWTTMMNYTVYQWTSGNFSWDPPGRIEGPVRMQAAFALTTGYTGTWSGSPRNQYLSDLNAMRLANPSLGDYRPFNNLPSSPQLYLQNSLQASEIPSPCSTAS